MPFQIKIRGDLIQRLPEITDGAGLLARLARVMAEQNELTVTQIVEKYASFPSDEPPTMDGLRSISGTLRRGYRASPPEISGKQIVSSIGNNVEYALIQEVGGQTGPHDIVARNSEALRFMIGGTVIFRKKVHHPGSDIPARQPVQRGLEDRLPAYGEAFSETIEQYLP